MKRLVVLITIVLLVVNIVLGTVLSAYQTTNVILNSFVILLTGIMLWILSSVQLKDAFKYSLSILFGIIGCSEYIVGFFAPSEWHHNWFAIVVIAIISIEIIILTLVNYVSNKNN